MKRKVCRITAVISDVALIKFHQLRQIELKASFGAIFPMHVFGQ